MLPLLSTTNAPRPRPVNSDVVPARTFLHTSKRFPRRVDLLEHSSHPSFQPEPQVPLLVTAELPLSVLLLTNLLLPPPLVPPSSQKSQPPTSMLPPLKKLLMKSRLPLTLKRFLVHPFKLLINQGFHRHLKGSWSILLSC